MVDTMHLNYVLVLVHAVKSIELEINGQVSFDLNILNYDSYKNKNDLRPIKRKSEAKTKSNKDTEVSLKVLRAGVPANSVTAAPVMECVYQYPEKEHVNSLLSNMMNQLTKIFVQVQDFMQKEEGRRKQDTRFRVISKKDTNFFENIYSNMTKEYRTLYNKTAECVERSGKDPCQHQLEIKGLWKELLEKSLWILQRASLYCMEELLRVQNRTSDIIIRNELKELLMSELGKMRSSQLDILCDNFQLCFNDLL